MHEDSEHCIKKGKSDNESTIIQQNAFQELAKRDLPKSNSYQEIKMNSTYSYKSFPENSLQNKSECGYFYVKKSKSYICKICNFKAKTLGLAKCHQYDHEEKKNVPISCQLCNEEFKTHVFLKIHMCLKHPHEKVHNRIKKNTVKEIKVRNSKSTVENFNCSTCNKNFLSLSDVFKHSISTSHRERCNNINTKQESVKIRRLLNIFLCQFCKVPYSYYGPFKKHQKLCQKLNNAESKSKQLGQKELKIGLNILPSSANVSENTSALNQLGNPNKNVSVHNKITENAATNSKREENILTHQYICSNCCKGFLTKQRLKVHTCSVNERNIKTQVMESQNTYNIEGDHELGEENLQNVKPLLSQYGIVLKESSVCLDRIAMTDVTSSYSFSNRLNETQECDYSSSDDASLLPQHFSCFYEQYESDPAPTSVEPPEIGTILKKHHVSDLIVASVEPSKVDVILKDHHHSSDSIPACVGTPEIGTISKKHHESVSTSAEPHELGIILKEQSTQTASRIFQCPTCTKNFEFGKNNETNCAFIWNTYSKNILK